MNSGENINEIQSEIQLNHNTKTKRKTYNSGL